MTHPRKEKKSNVKKSGSADREIFGEERREREKSSWRHDMVIFQDFRAVISFSIFQPPRANITRSSHHITSHPIACSTVTISPSCTHSSYCQQSYTCRVFTPLYDSLPDSTVPSHTTWQVFVFQPLQVPLVACSPALKAHNHTITIITVKTLCPLVLDTKTDQTR